MEGYSKYIKIINSYLEQCNQSNLVENLHDNTDVFHHILENGIHVYIKKTRIYAYDIVKVSTKELPSMHKKEGISDAREIYLKSEIYDVPSASIVMDKYTSGEYKEEMAFVQYNDNRDVPESPIYYSLPKIIKPYQHSKIQLDDVSEEFLEDIEQILQLAISSPDIDPDLRSWYEEALEEYRKLTKVQEKTQERPEEDKKQELIADIKGLMDENRSLDAQLQEKTQDEK